MNEPRPGQMTVRDLRHVLERIPDEAVVALAVPAGGIGDAQFATFVNVRVDYGGGLIVKIVPFDGDLSQPHPQRVETP